LEYTAKDLLEMEFAPLKWIIPNFLTEGLAVLGGKPKQGKTIFSIGLALAVSQGTDLFGNRIEANEGDAVYISLEDNYRLFKTRIERIEEAKKLSDKDLRGLRVHFDIPRIDNGGLEKIKSIVKHNSDVRLVVIDPLVNFKPAKAHGYDADYQYMAQLKNIADKYGIAVLLVHHLKKSKVTDAIDGFSGSVGITGAADNLMLLNRYNGDMSELLMIGKNIKSTSYAMRLNESSYWDVIGNLEEMQSTQGKQQIYDLFKKHPDVIFSPKEIAGACDLKVKYVKKVLPQFLQRADIIKVDHGQYQFKAKSLSDHLSRLKSPLGKVVVDTAELAENTDNIDRDLIESPQSH